MATAALAKPQTDPRLLTLKVNEVYLSIQGESTWAGLRCAFVRLTACDLRCTYCDTEYAFYEGVKRTVGDVLDEVLALDSPLVEITGGEPLLQKNVLPLMRLLCEAGRTVLIETSGAHDISAIDPRVHRIMDLKTPSSGECARNLYANIPHLTRRDEVKFVLGSREDYEWTRAQIAEHDLAGRCGAVLLSPVFGRIQPADIVAWMLEDRLEARFQLQMHKFIWDPKAKVFEFSARAPACLPRNIPRMRARLTKDFTFEAAQTLPNVPEGHKCRRMHGHSFKVEITIEGEVDPHLGWIYDHARISAAMDPLLELLDHGYLNEIEGLSNPTIENMAAWLWRHLAPGCPGLCEIVIHETPTARCIYRGE